MRRFLRMATVMVAVITALILRYASAGAENSYNGLNYSIDNGSVTITSCAWDQGANVVVPLTIEGLPVRAIGASAFKNQAYVTNITLPDTVESIGAGAFQNCTSLATISLGSGLKSLGDQAFEYCSKLTTVELPSSVNAIGASTFEGCTILSSINIPSGVTSIGDYTFSSCKALTSLTLPGGVTSIGRSAFGHCTNLVSVNLPDSVASIGESAFSSCSSLADVIIPEGVTSIGMATFSGCTGLKSVSIPSTVTAIGSSAFYKCTSLVSVNIPEGVTFIDNLAFYNCTSLKSVTLPGSLADGMTYVNSIFEDCTGLTSAVLSPGITVVGEDLFKGCTSLASVSSPATVTAIYPEAFSGCTSLKSVSLPSGLTTLYENAFYKTGLTSLTIPASLKAIYASAFQGCASLASLSLPEGVTSIKDNAFADCTALRSVTIPASLGSMGSGIFSGCTSLTSVTFSPGLASIGIEMFANCSKLAGVSFPASVLTIGNGAFLGCSGLTSVTVPGTVKNIGNGVFMDCTNLGSLTMSYGIESMGAQVTNGCPKLTIITLPESLTSLCDYAFGSNEYLTSLSIPSGVTSIGNHAFEYCTALKSLTIPSSVTSIGDYAFYNCTGLPSLTIPGSVQTLGGHVFEDCSSLVSVNFSSSGLSSIGICAFWDCKKLVNVYFPEGMTSLGNSAFYECDSLTDVYLPKSITYLWQPFPTTKPWIYVYEGSYAKSYCMGSGLSDRVQTIGVQLSQTSLSLKEGTSGQLWSTVVHYNTNRQVSWASDHPEVATVDQTGKITAIIPGSANITATVIGDEALTATCAIEVKLDLPKVTLNATTDALYPDQTLTLTATVLTEDGVDPGMTWASSDETVATVLDGVVTAVKAGSVIITATAADGSGKYATCQITVKQYATGVTLDKTSATLYTGDTLTLTPTVTPSDASDKRVTWASSDETVATVLDGVVTAVKAGMATITASAADGSSKSTSCEITVEQHVTNVSLDKTSATLYTGDTLTLTPTVTPSDASDKRVTWASSDETVATILDGVVTAVKAGTATITATAADGSNKNASCEITVKQYATGISLDKTSATLYTGETLTLTPTVTPSDASDKGVTWASGDDAVATVLDGVVTAHKAGTATITATAADGSGKYATCQIAVKQYATGVTLDKTSAPLYTGDTLTLTPTISPIDTSDKGVIWASSDETVATVADGVVTAVKAGSTTITATTEDGSNKSASCEITVKQHVTNVSLDKTSATLYTGDTLTLTPTVSPSDTSDKQVTWVSSDTAIATVSASGAVTAVKAGSATITATTADGSDQSAMCEITVKQHVINVSLDKTSATLYTGDTLTLTPTVSPDDASNKGVTWSSNNEAVATVSSSGVVTAHKAGTAAITATAADGSGKSAACQITVKQYATGISLNNTSASLYIGETLTLNATVSPADASNKGVTWASGDSTVATVSSSGVVTALKTGNVTITATAADGSGRSAGCQFTVWTPAASVTVGPVAQALLKPGDVLTLSADVQPASAHDRSVTWSTNNASVARVNGGVVTVAGRGTATITATTHNGKTATCAITVEDRVVDLTLSVLPADTPVKDDVYSVPVNGTLKIDTSVKPQGISYTCAFKSSDSKVASVSGTGVVTGLKNGRVTITVTAKDSKNLASQTRTLAVSVFTPVNAVTLPTEVQMLTGAAKKLTAAISPSGASDKALTWDSDDKAVATVAQDGTVTAKKAGTAHITATANSGKSASCLVRVTDPAAGVQITTETGVAYVNYKKYLQLNAQVSPGTAYGKVTWKSSNTTYVKVDSNGRIYGNKVGKATVYATAADGTGVRGSITIQVITPVTGVKLPETDRIFIGKAKKLAVSLSPSSPTFKTLTWQSGNEAVATVAQDGTVTAKALGTAVITATAYNGLSDSCTVTVAQPVTGITLAPENGFTVVYKGETVLLNPAITPGNASDKGVTWKSSSEKYAKVNGQGEVTGKNPGKVTITATAKDGGRAVGSIRLTIVAPETSIKLSKSSVVLYQNGTGTQKTLKLSATPSPKGAVYRKLTWSVVSGGDAATVDGSGLVTALKDGAAVVRATTDRLHYAECTVAVRTLPTSLTLKATEKTLAFKQKFDLNATASFDSACTEKALTWTTSNKKVATVSQAGVVTASKDKTGTATITATTKNGKTATCKITVVKNLPKTTPPDAATVEAVQPQIALRLTGGGYATSDAQVADVAGNGEVTLNKDGTAALMAGDQQILVKVEGGNPVELKMDEGSELMLLSDAQIQWRVDDDRVASIDKNGNLTALSEGVAEVTCEVEDGDSLKILITVKAAKNVLPLSGSALEAEPALTPEPTDALEPTTAPEPTVTPEQPSAPEPTTAPEPTAAPDPTTALEPTAAPDPTMAPEPTAAPDPTTAPEPTAAPPKPEPTPDGPSDAQADTSVAD